MLTHKMFKELLDKQKRGLEPFFSSLNLDVFAQVVEKIYNCSGIIVVSGVGKSGHIAEKISATLVSTGTRSSYLCPSHALHGDLGFFRPNDLLLLLSKSGESQELIDLLPHAKKKGVFTIGAVSQVQSRLAKEVDLVMDLPLGQELCPFDLAPTTSTTIQLLFGDCLAISLMKCRQFTMDDFAMNHPGGWLGRKISMKVSDCMLKGTQLPKARASDRIMDVLHELSSKQCGALLVCDEESRLQGIFTDGDLRRAIEAKGSDALEMEIKTLMTKSPITIAPEVLLMEAIEKMEGNGVRRVHVLPVLQEGKVIGLLRLHDVSLPVYTRSTPK